MANNKTFVRIRNPIPIEKYANMVMLRAGVSTFLVPKDNPTERNANMIQMT